jgi:hypothetical protein
VTPTPLTARLDAVCQARRWTDREWSRRAGKSEGYVGTHRHRAANPEYELPEDAADALAAAAGVRVRWLRHGEDPMHGPEILPPTQTADARQHLIATLSGAIPALTAAGDTEAARIAATALQELLASPTESQTRPRFAPLHKP